MNNLLSFNLKKTKVMSTGVIDKFIIGNETEETAESFIFLGTELNKTGNSSTEMKIGLALGQTALRKLDKIWKSNDVSLGTKKRHVLALVFPVVLYESEVWTVLKADRKKINFIFIYIYLYLYIYKYYVCMYVFTYLYI